MIPADPRRPAIDHLIAALLDAWAVLVPVTCAGCGSHDRSLCADCLRRLIPSIEEDAAAPVRWSFADGTPGVAALRYDPLVAAVLLACKQDARLGLIRPLAGAMRQTFDTAVTEATAGSDVVIEVATVPATRRAAIARGFHPVERLVRRLGRHPVRPLRWERQPADQRDFGRTERFANLDGALAARGRLDGRRFLLVDDVVTTGATAAEAIRAIRAGGGSVAAVVALARVDGTPLGRR